MKELWIDSVTLHSDSTEQNPPLGFVAKIKSLIVAFNIIPVSGFFKYFCS